MAEHLIGETRQVVREYFQAGAESFWEWADDDAAIAWRDGKTIVFAEELYAVLRSLAPLGLPRFGSLLLLLAATRKNWATDGSEAGVLRGVLDVAFEPDDARYGSGMMLLQDAMEGLHRVRSFDSSLRTSHEAKVALANVVLGEAPLFKPASATAVTGALRPGLAELLATPPGDTAPTLAEMGVALIASLADLNKGLKRASPESVRLRMATGLDALPAPAPEEVAPQEPSISESARRTIQQLLESPEHAGLSRIASRLLASVSLPRKLNDSHSQETGGFSDITNRGDPDRLLLSELAQDGLTLAVRVSMNEAMYLHHETPPSTPRVRRELLIDSGVRAWGTPRVFAAGTALALAASTPKTAGFGAWRADRTELREVDLRSVDGVVDHLGALAPTPHVGDALPAFAEQIATSDESVEAVLIMPHDAWQDEEVRRAVRDLPAERVFIATVDRGGDFQLIERSGRRERVVRQARIDLGELVEGGDDLLRPRDAEGLPAIFQLERFPLRLSHQAQACQSWYLKRWGALAVTKDGRLMRWTDLGRGAIQLSDQMPPGKLWWASPDVVGGVTRFVVGSSDRLVLVSANLSSGQVRMVPIEATGATNVVMANQVLMVVCGGEVAVVDTQSGALADRLKLPTRWVCRTGRYLRRAKTRTNDDEPRFQALSSSGLTPVLEEVPLTNKANARAITDLWDIRGSESPLGFTAGGSILDAPKGEVLMGCAIRACKLSSSGRAGDWRLAWISPDGVCVGIACDRDDYHGNPRPQRYRVDLEANTIEWDNPEGTDGRVAKLMNPAQHRSKFTSLGLNANNDLTLRDVKGFGYTITRRNGQLVFVGGQSAKELRFEQPFELLSQSRREIRLAEARWPNGCRAVLDSRGLLHLSAADTDIPELTLVLADGELTGWCNAPADSHAAGFFGRDYFGPTEDHYSPTAGDADVPRAFVRAVIRQTLFPFTEAIADAG